MSSNTVVSKPPDLIGFTGTHGAGKTTAARLLGPSLGMPTITYSRPTAAAQQLGFEKASQVPSHLRQQFQWLALFEQMFAVRRHTRCVADRTELEFWAYWEFETAGAGRDEGYAMAAAHQMKKYDVIFYLPPNKLIAPEDNGKRYVEHAAEIDELVLEGIRRFGLEPQVHHVQADNPYDRLEEMHEELRRRGFEIQPMEVRL